LEAEALFMKEAESVWLWGVRRGSNKIFTASTIWNGSFYTKKRPSNRPNEVESLCISCKNTS